MNIPIKDHDTLVQVVGAITLPSILWLVFRFAKILLKRRTKILHHITHPEQASLFGSASYTFHIIMGLLLLATMPYSAYLCLPPTITTTNDDYDATILKAMPLSASITDRYFLLFLALALVGVNGSVIPILPHISRYASYQVSKPRGLARGLSPLYTSSMSFLCMALTTVAFFTSGTYARSSIFILTIMLYAIIAMICVCEVLQYPWESISLIHVLLFNFYGPKRKSRLTEAYIQFDQQDSRAINIILPMFFFPAVIAIIQTYQMLQMEITNYNNNNNNNNSDDKLQVLFLGLHENFFVVTMLYITVTMSSGFFIQAQAVFDVMDDEQQQQQQQSSPKENNGTTNNNNDNSSNNTVVVPTVPRLILFVDVLMTQLLPLCILIIGPNWIQIMFNNNSDDNSSSVTFGEFLYRYLLWLGPPSLSTSTTS